jgi:carboxyl-terminal processing protease
VRGNRGVQVPIVVLVNGGSASASEIVTGSIQDHDRGLVVGEQTFGKGWCRRCRRLSENTGLALTTARYYTPSGRLIQRDYKDVSLYDYLYNHKNPSADGGQADRRRPAGIRRRRYHSGRSGERAEAECLPGTAAAARCFLPLRGEWAALRLLTSGPSPIVTKDFVVDDNVIAEFRRVLDKEKVTYTDADIAANLDWIKREIKKEVFISVFGLPAGDQVELEDDPQVVRAIEALPQARALYENVRHIIAQRTSLDKLVCSN